MSRTRHALTFIANSVAAVVIAAGIFVTLANTGVISRPASGQFTFGGGWCSWKLGSPRRACADPGSNSTGRHLPNAHHKEFWMPIDGKLRSTSERQPSRDPRRQASNYDMFESLQQTRRRASEANRKRLLESDVPVTSPVSEE
jgi:hypothetical protein